MNKYICDINTKYNKHLLVLEMFANLYVTAYMDFDIVKYALQMLFHFTLP